MPELGLLEQILRKKKPLSNMTKRLAQTAYGAVLNDHQHDVRSQVADIGNDWDTITRQLQKYALPSQQHEADHRCRRQMGHLGTSSSMNRHIWENLFPTRLPQREAPKIRPIRQLCKERDPGAYRQHEEQSRELSAPYPAS
jgi:hypothetical protein